MIINAANYCFFFFFSPAVLSNMLHNTRFHRFFVIKPCKVIIRALCEMSNRKKVHRGTRWKSVRANQLYGLAASKPLWESQHWGWHCWLPLMKTWLTPCKINIICIPIITCGQAAIVSNWLNGPISYELKKMSFCQTSTKCNIKSL